MQRMQHIFNKHDDFQKAKSILTMHIRIERIDLNAYLYFKNVSDINSLRGRNNHNARITNFEKEHYKQDRVNLEDD